MTADRLEALAQRWESRGLKSHPTDTMLINLHVRELRETMAALRAEAGAVGWMPIETAPKDGSAFLAMSDYQVTDRGDLIIWMAEFEKDQFRSVWDGEPLWDMTHWQPLPPRPSQKD